MFKYFMICLVVLISGCITKVELPTDLKIKSITHEGVSGKFIPNKVFDSIMIRYLEWEYYNSKYGNIKE